MNNNVSHYQQFTDVFTNAMQNKAYIQQESNPSVYLQENVKSSVFKTRQITEKCRECINFFSTNSSQPLENRMTTLTKLEGALQTFANRIQESITHRWWYPILHFFGYNATIPKHISDLLKFAHDKQEELQRQQARKNPIASDPRSQSNSDTKEQPDSSFSSDSHLSNNESENKSENISDSNSLNQTSSKPLVQENLNDQRLQVFREIFKPLNDCDNLSEIQYSSMKDMLNDMSIEELKTAFESTPNCFYLKTDHWKASFPLSTLGALLHLMPADKLSAFYHLCLTHKELYLNIANLILLSSYNKKQTHLIPHLQNFFQLMSARDLIDFVEQLKNSRNWNFKPSLFNNVLSFLSENSRHPFYKLLVQEPDTVAYFIEEISEQYPQEAAKILQTFLLQKELSPLTEENFSRLLWNLSDNQNEAIAQALFPLLDAQGWGKLRNLCNSTSHSSSFFNKMLKLIQDPSHLSLILTPEALANKESCFETFRSLLSHPNLAIRESACLSYVQGPLCQVHGFIAFFQNMSERSKNIEPLIDQLVLHLNPLQLILLQSPFIPFNRRQASDTLQRSVKNLSLSVKDYLALGTANETDLTREDVLTLKPLLFNQIEQILRDNNTNNWADLIKSLEAKELAFLLDIMPKHNDFGISESIWWQCTQQYKTGLQQVQDGLRLFLENASDQTIEQIHSYFSRAFRFQSSWYIELNPRQRLLTLSYWLNKDVEEFSSGIDTLFRQYSDNQAIRLEIIQFCESQSEEKKQQFYPLIAEMVSLSSLIEEASGEPSKETRGFFKGLFTYLTDLSFPSLEKISLLHEDVVEELLETCQNNLTLSLKLIFAAHWQTPAKLQKQLHRCLQKTAFSNLLEKDIKSAAYAGLNGSVPANLPIFLNALGSIDFHLNNQNFLAAFLSAIVYHFHDKGLKIDVSHFEGANLTLLFQIVIQHHKESDFLSEILESISPYQMAQLLCSISFSKLEEQGRPMRFWTPLQVTKLFSHLRPDKHELLFEKITFLGYQELNLNFLGSVAMLYKDAQAPLLKIFIDQAKNSNDRKRLIPLLYFSDFFQLRLLKGQFTQVLKDVSSPLAFVNESQQSIVDLLPNSDLKLTAKSWMASSNQKILYQLNELDQITGEPLVNFKDIESFISSIKQEPEEQAKGMLSNFSPYQLIIAWHFMDENLKAWASEVHTKETIILCRQLPLERLLLAHIEPDYYPTFVQSLTSEQKQNLFGIEDLSLQSIRANRDRITPAGICVAFCLSKEKNAWEPLLAHLNIIQLLALYEFLSAEQKARLLPHLTSEKLFALLNLASVQSKGDESSLGQALSKQLSTGAGQEIFSAKNLLWSNEKELTGQMLRLFYHLHRYEESTLKGTYGKDKDKLKHALQQNMLKINPLPHANSFINSLLTKPNQEWNWQENLIAKLSLEILVNLEQKSELEETVEIVNFAHLNQIHQKLQSGLGILQKTKELNPFVLALTELLENLHQTLEENEFMKQMHEDVNYLSLLNQEIYCYYLKS